MQTLLKTVLAKSQKEQVIIDALLCICNIFFIMFMLQLAAAETAPNSDMLMYVDDDDMQVSNTVNLVYIQASVSHLNRDAVMHSEHINDLFKNNDKSSFTKLICKCYCYILCYVIYNDKSSFTKLISKCCFYGIYVCRSLCWRLSESMLTACICCSCKTVSVKSCCLCTLYCK